MMQVLSMPVGSLWDAGWLIAWVWHAVVTPKHSLRLKIRAAHGRFSLLMCAQSMYKSQPKLPGSVFRDFSSSGPMHVIGLVCAEAMKARGMKRIDWASPALRREVLRALGVCVCKEKVQKYLLSMCCSGVCLLLNLARSSRSSTHPRRPTPPSPLPRTWSSCRGCARSCFAAASSSFRACTCTGPTGRQTACASRTS